MVQLGPQASTLLPGNSFALDRLCLECVDPKGISAMVACRLIALNKCPGVRPIAVGETARRIIGKAIATAVSNDIQEAAGPLQVCAGHLSGCEAAVHAMHQVFQSSDTKAVILVDACNARRTGRLLYETSYTSVPH